MIKRASGLGASPEHVRALLSRMEKDVLQYSDEVMVYNQNAPKSVNDLKAVNRGVIDFGKSSSRDAVTGQRGMIALETEMAKRFKEE